MKSILFFLSLLIAFQAHAFPTIEDAPSFSEIATATNDDLRGMISNRCSGALVHLGRGMDQRAVVMTNGHCAVAGFIVYKSFVANKPYTRSTISVGIANTMKLVTPLNVLYGTMTHTDVALIEIQETYQELVDLGARVFEISSTLPADNTPVTIVSGYWKEKQLCAIEYSVPSLQEDAWTMTGSLALTKNCKIRGGYSGSPIVQTNTTMIVGVVNTVNENGDRCMMNNPCEVDAAGNVKVEFGRGYGQRVNDIAGCLTPQGNIDLSLTACKLYH